MSVTAEDLWKCTDVECCEIQEMPEPVSPVTIAEVVVTLAEDLFEKKGPTDVTIGIPQALAIEWVSRTRGRCRKCASEIVPVCLNCEGSGKVNERVEYYDQGMKSEESSEDCPACEGFGFRR